MALIHFLAVLCLLPQIELTYPPLQNAHSLLYQKAIEDLGPHDGCLYFITLDTGSGFQKIAVANDTMDKLAIFGLAT